MAIFRPTYTTLPDMARLGLPGSLDQYVPSGKYCSPSTALMRVSVRPTSVRSVSYRPVSDRQVKQSTSDRQNQTDNDRQTMSVLCLFFRPILGLSLS